MVLSSAFSIKISQFSSRKDQKQGVRTPREVRVSSKIIEKSYKKISRHHELNKAHLVQLQLMYTPLFSRTEQEKNPIGVTNERVISSSENNRIGVTKEGRKFIEKITEEDTQKRFAKLNL